MKFINTQASEASSSDIRINRFFTENGLMSRREADRVIEAGEVTINGRRAKLGDRVQPEDRVALRGREVRTGLKRPVILAYNKPVGVECTTNEDVPGNIISAVRYPERVFHVGRLDKDSEGLILLTNIGDIVNKILRAEHCHEKEYVVTVDQPINDTQMAKLRGGVRLSDGMTRPCRITRENGRRIRMVLTEGRNRQIRRMVASLGLEVTQLRRVRIMGIKLGGLPRGHWHKFTKAEADALLQQL